MKKRILLIIILIIIITIGIWLYLDIKENKRIDAEAVTLSEDLTVEFGKDVKISDFIENLNGTLLENYKIDTEYLGQKEVSFEFLNIRNKKRKANFTITVVDKTKPQIFSGSSYTVEVGY